MKISGAPVSGMGFSYIDEEIKMIHTAITNVMIHFPAVLAVFNLNENAKAATAAAVEPGNALAAAGLAALAGAVIYIKRHMESWKDEKR